jgi:hypothetical protein
MPVKWLPLRDSLGAPRERRHPAGPAARSHAVPSCITTTVSSQRAPQPTVHEHVAVGQLAASTCGGPPLGAPASCRPSGAFARSPQPHHPDRQVATSPSAHRPRSRSRRAARGVHLRGPPAGSAGILPAQRRVRIRTPVASPRPSGRNDPLSSPSTSTWPQGCSRCPPAGPPLGPPASCRPSGAFARSSQLHHHDRKPVTTPFRSCAVLPGARPPAGSRPAHPGVHQRGPLGARRLSRRRGGERLGSASLRRGSYNQLKQKHFL